MRKQGNTDKIVMAFITCNSNQEVAELFGVSETTVCNWRKDTEIKEAYNRAISELLKDSMSELKRGAVDGIRFLRGTVNNLDEATATRLQASKILCELNLKYESYYSIEERLRALEERFF